MDSDRERGRPHLAEPALSVVMPVYNEGENITPTLRGLLHAVEPRPLEVLVVYDFDADTTVPVVRRLQAEFPEVHLLHNQIGRGVLNAIKAGFAEASGPHVLVMMADGSDDPNDIETMLTAARGGADLVAASRYMRGGAQIGGPRLKRLLSRTAGLSLHWFSGIPIHDPTSNFKLYGRRLLRAVSIESTAGFELGLELSVKAYRLGMPMTEVPTTWRDRTVGESRFRMWSWIPHYLHWYWYGLRARFRRGR